MRLLVFAAGIGSRFGGVKQLMGVDPYGETLLEYSLFDALHAGFDHFVFLIRPEMEEDFRTGILTRLPGSLSYSLAYQTLDSLLDEASHARLEACGRTKPWGTGHALLCAREQLESTGPFAVINADDYYGPLGFKKVGVRLCSNPEEFCFQDIDSRMSFQRAAQCRGRFAASMGRSISKQLWSIKASGVKMDVFFLLWGRDRGIVAGGYGLDEPLGIQCLDIRLRRSFMGAFSLRCGRLRD